MTNANRLFATLADPTRAAILERLGQGPASVTEIARGLPVSQPAVSQHLGRLKEDGLVRVEVQGQRRIYRIDPSGLGPIREWLDRLWSAGLGAFKELAEDEAKGDSE